MPAPPSVLFPFIRYIPATVLMAPVFIPVDDKDRRLYQCPGCSPSVDCGNAVALSRNPGKTGNYIGACFSSMYACRFMPITFFTLIPADLVKVWRMSIPL